MTRAKAGGRRYGAARIPEDVQAPYQHRLKVLRTGRGLAYKDVHTFGYATLQKIETEDMSTLKMGDLAALATEYGMTLGEMFQVLASATDEGAERAEESEEARRIQRIAVFMRTLPDALQEMVVDIVHRVMVHNTDVRTTGQARQEVRQVVNTEADRPARTNDTTRDLVRQRLREAQDAERAAGIRTR